MFIPQKLSIVMTVVWKICAQQSELIHKTDGGFWMTSQSFWCTQKFYKKRVWTQ